MPLRFSSLWFAQNGTNKLCVKQDFQGNFWPLDNWHLKMKLTLSILLFSICWKDLQPRLWNPGI
jgi:hypothetical protein